MKKIAAIFIIFGIMLAVSVAETVLTSSKYGALYQKLLEVDGALTESGKDTTSVDVTKKIDELDEMWKGDKVFLMIFTNHTSAKMMEEKIITLKVWAQNGNYDETKLAVEVAVSYAEGLKNDSKPAVENVF